MNFLFSINDLLSIILLSQYNRTNTVLCVVVLVTRLINSPAISILLVVPASGIEDINTRFYVALKVGIHKVAKEAGKDCALHP